MASKRFVIRRATVGSAFMLVGLLPLSGGLWAHHGDAGRWDENTVTLSGTVVALQLVNPHSTIIFDVAGEEGAVVRWRAELTSPISLAENHGWNKNTLTPGDEITVVGRPIKSGDAQINLSERANIVRTDTCEELYRTRSQPEAPAPGTPCAT